MSIIFQFLVLSKDWKSKVLKSLCDVYIMYFLINLTKDPYFGMGKNQKLCHYPTIYLLSLGKGGEASSLLL